MIRLAAPVVLLLAAVGTGCEPASDPLAVARSFWGAAQRGDAAAARELVSAASAAQVSDPGGEGSGIVDVRVTDASQSSNRATLETRLVNTWAGTTREIVFTTTLVHEQGAWRVDLDRTAGAIVRTMALPRWLGGADSAAIIGDSVMARDTATLPPPSR